MSWFAYERPPLVRVAICFAYIVATTGLLLLAFSPNVLFDRWPIVAASVATLVLLGLILVTGHGGLYLGVGAAWIYASVMALIRPGTADERTGLGLVFLSLAFGALAAYTAYRREAPLRP